MTLPLRELAIAAFIALGFAGIGEVALRRTSSTVADLNAALLVGMGVCATLLFPLSLAWPGRALTLSAALVVCGALWTVVARLLGRGRRSSKMPTSIPRDSDAPLVLTAAAVAGLVFAALDLRYNFLWDGFQIWASKAQLLFVQGGLTRESYPSAQQYELRHLAYPNLLSLYEALVGLARGAFDFEGLKPIFLVFYASMAVSTYAAARARAGASLGAWAALLVCLVPELSTGWAAGAYADMPQAAAVAAVAAAAMRGDSRALPWLVGTLTAIKSEGTVLAVLACAAAAVYALAERRSGRTPPGWLRFAAIAGAFLAVRIALLRWIHVTDTVYAMDAAHLRDAWTRIPRLAGLCAAELLSLRGWGLLWPAFFAAVAVLLRRGADAEKALALGTGSAVAVLASPLLFTTWPLELHFGQAYPRLLAQIAPAAVVATVLGYARASDRRPLDPPTGLAAAAR